MRRLKPNIVQLFFILALFVILPNNAVLAQNLKINFEKIRATNGVSFGKISSITQDELGFMWFSDQSNGTIMRYDGSHMKLYKHDPLNSNSLGGNYPEFLFATDTGIIWIGFYGQGLDRFDPLTNTFTHYRHDPDDPNSLINDIVSTVLEDHLGNVWVGTDGGLDLLDPDTGNFTHFRHIENDSTSLSHDMVRTLYEDRSGTLWVGTGFAFDLSTKEGGLNRFDRKTGNFKQFLHKPDNPKSLVSNKVRAILEDSHGNFWVGTDGDGLHSMDRKTREFTRHTYDPNQPEKLSRPALNSEWDHITFLVEDTLGKIWIGTESGGLNLFDPVTNSISHFGKETRNFESLINNDGWEAFSESNSGWCAYATDDGHLWLSSQYNSNLFKIDLYNNYIPFYLDDGSVPSFFEESETIFWKATSNGLLREDMAEGTSRRYLHDPKDPNSISNNSITSIIKDHQNQFWIGTEHGLNKLDITTGTFTHYLPDPNDPVAISNDHITAVYEDSKFNLWIGTNGGGLNLMDRNTGAFRQFRNNPKDLNSLSGDMITNIQEDSQGGLWIGVEFNGAGLNQFQPLTEDFKRYLPGLSVLNLLLDDNSLLWVGTAYGLYRYDPKSDDFENTNITSNITEVINDSENNLWLYNSNGIIRYDQQNENTMLYSGKNGVRGILEAAQRGNPYRKSDGTILFGSYADGYHAFIPDKLWTSRDTSLVYFTEFRIAGESDTAGIVNVLGESVNSGGNITLAHNQNIFSIQFTAIDYRNSQNRHLFYMLENYDSDWLQTYAENPANYYKVPPGEYTFRIKAANSSSGIWSEKSFQLTISPPWWATWWAFCIYGLLFIGGVLLIHRYQKARVIRAEREKAQKKELAQAKEIEKAYGRLKSTQTQLIQSEKMASLGELTAGIAHEIQNPLNFVNNFSEVSNELIDEMNEEIEKGDLKEAKAIAKDIKQNLEKINHHGKRADGIVKGMLQHSRSSSGQKEPTDINKLTDEYFRLAYHGLRAKNKSFNATLETDYEENLGKIDVIPQDIGRVILNLFTNAFYAVDEKKSKSESTNYKPTVSVSTEKIKDKVVITVRDNGNGIPKEALDKIFQPFFTTKPTGKGTGLGLSMSYDIIKAHKGELTVNTAKGKFTEFKISIPIKNNSTA